MQKIATIILCFFINFAVSKKNKATVPLEGVNGQLLEWVGYVPKPGIISMEMYDAENVWQIKFQLWPKKQTITIQSSTDRRLKKCSVEAEVLGIRSNFSIFIFFKEEELDVYMDGEIKLNYPFDENITPLRSIRVYGRVTTHTLSFITIPIAAEKINERSCGTAISENIRVPETCRCKPDDPAAWKIVGGKDAIPGKLPWQVSIRARSPYENVRGYPHRCGGTLIGRCWVLTAAHCFPATTSTALRRVYVRVGDYNNKDDSFCGNIRDIEDSQDFDIRKVYIHEKFVRDPLRNDIALVRLKQCVQYGTFVKPICLPSAIDQFSAGKICGISGWGASNETEEVNEYPPCLQTASIAIKTLTTCKKAYDDTYLPDKMLCAGDEFIDTCQGDSGGPLICVNSATKSTLWGITSWGIGCARRDKPGVYTRVAAFVPWVYKTMNTRRPDRDFLVKISKARLPVCANN